MVCKSRLRGMHLSKCLTFPRVLFLIVQGAFRDMFVDGGMHFD